VAKELRYIMTLKFRAAVYERLYLEHDHPLFSLFRTGQVSVTILHITI